ncbi:hypothetical protein K440DRAFT_644540 [Wilcoxina mikolae CBS 423.85]|nr:hypothetical protein K440DRAFT_644540 [Wilcoxina mikolae CBS 423.85]
MGIFLERLERIIPTNSPTALMRVWRLRISRSEGIPHHHYSMPSLGGSYSTKMPVGGSDRQTQPALLSRPLRLHQISPEHMEMVSIALSMKPTGVACNYDRAPPNYFIRLKPRIAVSTNGARLHLGLSRSLAYVARACSSVVVGSMRKGRLGFPHWFFRGSPPT